MSVGMLILGLIFLVSAIIIGLIAFSARILDFKEVLFDENRFKERFRKKEKLKQKIDALKKASEKSDVMYSFSPLMKLKIPDEFESSGKVAKEPSSVDDAIEQLKSEIEEIEKMEESLEEEETPMPSSLASRSDKKEDIPDVDKRDVDEILEELEPEEEAKEDSRDFAAIIPKNMCLKEVFRIRVVISKGEKYTKDIQIEEIRLKGKEAEHFSTIKSRFAEKFSEVKTRIYGLEEGPLKIRPIPIGGYAIIQPATRTINFNLQTEKFIIEFFISPKLWLGSKMNSLRIELEQKNKVLKVVDIPVKVYKRKYEAIFGLNISLWQKYGMAIYSVIGALVGAYGTLANYVSFLPVLF